MQMFDLYTNSYQISSVSPQPSIPRVKVFALFRRLPLPPWDTCWYTWCMIVLFSLHGSHLSLLGKHLHKCSSEDWEVYSVPTRCSPWLNVSAPWIKHKLWLSSKTFFPDKSNIGSTWKLQRWVLRYLSLSFFFLKNIVSLASMLTFCVIQSTLS